MLRAPPCVRKETCERQEASDERVCLELQQRNHLLYGLKLPSFSGLRAPAGVRKETCEREQTGRKCVRLELHEITSFPNSDTQFRLAVYKSRLSEACCKAVPP